MYLTADIGNSSIALGVFRGDDFLEITRLDVTAADLSQALSAALRAQREKFAVSAEPIRIAAVSVVPRLNDSFTKICREVFATTPEWITHAANFQMPISVSNPNGVGLDRLVNAAFAKSVYKAPLIVVDLGTATTFDVVSPVGNFIGGAIAPGLGVSLAALTTRAPSLPNIPLELPARVIGGDTVAAMQSGSILGYAAFIDGMISRITEELGGQTEVIATGGFAELVCRAARSVTILRPSLTLEGIRWLADRQTS